MYMENPTGKMENGHVTSGLGNVDSESAETIEKDESLLKPEGMNSGSAQFYSSSTGSSFYTQAHTGSSSGKSGQSDLT